MIQPFRNTDEAPATLPLYERMSDAELICLYLKSDNASIMEVLVGRHAGLVHSVVSRVSVCKEDAEDSFQATFMVFAKSMRKIKKAESLPSWLYGVAYRIAKRLRNNTLDNRRIQSLTQIEVTSIASNAVDQVSNTMELEKLDREVNRLPDSLRAVIVERYYLGHSLQEISDRMEISLSAVDGRLRRARSILRSRLLMIGFSATALLGNASSTAKASLASPNLITSTLDRIQGSIQSSTVHGPTSFQQLVQGELAMFSKFKFGLLSLAGGTLLVVTTGALIINAGQPSASHHDSTLTLSSGEIPIEDSATSTAQVFVSETSAPAKSTSSSTASPPNVDKVDATIAAETDPFGDMAEGSFGGSGNLQNGGDMAEDPFGGSGTPQVANPQTNLGRTMEELERLSSGELDLLKARHELKTERSIQIKLMTTTVNPDYLSIPLRSVIDQLSGESGIAMQFDERSLEDAAITADEPISLQVHTSMTVDQVLDTVLNQVQLDYRIKNGFLMITAENDEPILRIYPLEGVEDSYELVACLESWITFENDPMVIGDRLALSATPDIHEEVQRILALLQD